MMRKNIAWFVLQWDIALNFLFLTGVVPTEWNPCESRDLRITGERPVALSGRWVSQRCETRAGPRFLLRDYEFSYNTSFHLRQYYFSDECTTPLYSLTLRGVLNEMKKSWMLPGAIDVDLTLTRVTVMPYSQSEADRIQAEVVKVCPLARFSANPWEPFQQEEIFNFELYPTTRAAHIAPEHTGVSRIDVEFDCLEALDFNFDELNLIRIQRRRWLNEHGHVRSRKELMTGESPRSFGEMNGAAVERPISYLADALVKVEHEGQESGCATCEIIRRVSNPIHPPKLSPKTNHVPYHLRQLHGRWHSVSECETRSSGSFIRRFLTLYPETQEWLGEYQHFTEPECQQRSFTIIGSGTFGLLEAFEPIPSAQKIDFVVLNATVTPHLDFVVQQLSTSNQSDCGQSPWLINVMKDITITGGCALLGLTVPNADFNIIKLEQDSFYNGFLFLGQETDVGSPAQIEGQATRPTVFQAPLVRCPETPSTTTRRTTTVHYTLKERHHSVVPSTIKYDSLRSSTESTVRPETKRPVSSFSKRCYASLSLVLFSIVLRWF